MMHFIGNGIDRPFNSPLAFCLNYLIVDFGCRLSLDLYSFNGIRFLKTIPFTHQLGAYWPIPNEKIARLKDVSHRSWLADRRSSRFATSLNPISGS